MKFRVLLASVVSAYLMASPALATYDRDQPLFSAYPGADLNRAFMFDYEKFAFPVSVVDSSKAFKSVEAVGDLYMHTYEIKNASTVKVFENYVAAAKQVGFKPLFTCALDACGGETEVRYLGSQFAVAGDVYNYWTKAYYWVGEKESPKGKIMTAWFVGAYEDNVRVQQVVVEGEPLETGLVKVNEAYANQGASPTKAQPLSSEEKAKDSDLLPRYPGAKIYADKKVDTETVTIAVPVNSAVKTPLNLTGDLSQHTYTIDNVSTLKVYENYKSALTSAGFSVIAQCELSQCGDEKQVKELGGKLALSGDVYNWRSKPYYLLAKKSQVAGNAYVALFIGGYEDTAGVQQIVLKEKQVETGLVTVNADQLKQQIDSEGKALIYGIYFDTGKAGIKPESKPTLDAIAELLKRDSGLLLYVVGHTDDTGDGAANVSLSKQRADSVVNALVTNYQIAASRLQAQGVGPYAPASNNTSDAGKQKNRRVELVKRLR